MSKVLISGFGALHYLHNFKNPTLLLTYSHPLLIQKPQCTQPSCTAHALDPEQPPPTANYSPTNLATKPATNRRHSAYPITVPPSRASPKPHTTRSRRA
ncbi:hypothetical protein T440DRAFT_470328 [Plenodomus tracheiphilus IPT5]|uniref:Uncharacterized protein n=1 Tax=Plenodomus tracheiphilus IPT5 TaxID=1408161 RepID=A0A6A7B1I5_9PLEO|nr:hypothetical protein T440DRAFT_470328 [Plenodomus tracheiphilus IPT5]